MQNRLFFNTTVTIQRGKLGVNDEKVELKRIERKEEEVYVPRGW